MNKAELNLMDSYLSHQVSLLRFTAGEQTKTLALLKQMQVELKAKLRNGLTDFSKARVNKILKEAGEVIDNYYAKTAESLDSLALAKNEAKFTANTFAGIGLDASLPSEAALKALVNESLIEGAQSSAWWSRQADDLQFKFANQVRQGIVQNETLQTIIRRVAGSKRLGIPGIMDVSRRNASALVHTSIMQVANDSRLATFRANDDIIKGMRQLSTMDSNTSIVCVTYSGAEWDLDGNPINGNTLPFNSGCPRHFSCRSLIVPATLSYRELGIDVDEPKGTRASDLGQIPSDTTFDGFLKRHDAAYADDLLGPGRAKLWRDGKITLNDLVNQTGRPLTLEQLAGKTTKRLTSFDNVIKYSGKKTGLKETISEIKNIVKTTGEYNAKYALTAVNDLKKKTYQGASIVSGNQTAAISWIKDTKHDALKVVTLGSNMPGGGTAMMKEAVQASMDAGYKGKLTLVSVRDFKTGEFYWDKVGMVDLKGGIPMELVLTPENAKKFTEAY